MRGAALALLLSPLAALCGLVVDGVRVVPVCDRASTNDVAGAIAVHDEAADAHAALFGAYPVFVIPLNGREGWSEVELKASTNNFFAGGMVYWFESLGLDAYGGAWTNHSCADLGAALFYCNADEGNGRAWQRWTNALTLTEQIGVNGNYQDTVVVIPSLTVKGGVSNLWMRPQNVNLIWSYRRRTAAEGETNALGRTVWHPIVPNNWRAAPVVP